MLVDLEWEYVGLPKHISINKNLDKVDLFPKYRPKCHSNSKTTLFLCYSGTDFIIHIFAPVLFQTEEEKKQDAPSPDADIVLSLSTKTEGRQRFPVERRARPPWPASN